MGNYVQPLANGIRTDHPIPDLPFVDDAHIPIEVPDDIEAIGRDVGPDRWGRCDVDDETGGWSAFTTDNKNPDYAWVVRYHPEHGRSVTLYRDKDGPAAHDTWFSDARSMLLARKGGYWWDGTTWFRPRQVLSLASERYMHRPARAASTITAGDLLDNASTTTTALPSTVMFDPEAAPSRHPWAQDLAEWASRREPGSLPLERCVVTVSAPELDDAALLTVDQVAQQAGIAASTLRAYLTRGEGDIPEPQTSEGSRKRWAKPVIDDWLEQRRRDPAAVATILTGDEDDHLSPGVSALWKRLSKALFHDFWSRKGARQQWARAHRSEQTIQRVADEASWVAVMHMETHLPDADVLSWTVHDAVMWQFHDARGQTAPFIGLLPQTGKMLGWFIQFNPKSVTTLFGRIVGEAEQRLGIPPEVSRRSLEIALRGDGKLDYTQDQIAQFFDLAMPPTK